MEEQNRILYNVMVQEAVGLYGQIFTTCIVFLGWTLVFYKKLFDNDNIWSMLTLVSGWGCLIISLVCIIVVRWYNIQSHKNTLKHNTMETEEDSNSSIQAEKTSKCSRYLTILAMVFMVSGLTLISISATIQVLQNIFD